jgi:hypothetical protein
MTDDDLKKLIEAIEARSYEYDFQIADEFKKIADENEVTSKQSKLLETEFIAFRFMSRNGESKRFHPMAEFTNGAVFPDDSKEVGKERLSYWLERARLTSNPVMKARYSDLNYEYNDSIKKSELAELVVSSYIDASGVSVEGNEIDRIDSVTRAFEVALKNEADKPDLLITAKNALLKLSDKFAKDNLRWALDLLELIILHSDKFSEDELLSSKKIADEGVKSYQAEEGSQLVLESYMKAQQALTKLATPADYDEDAATLANAQLHIDNADVDNASPFLVQYHLMQAEKILRDGGLNAEANKIHSRMESVAKDPNFTKSFKVASADFQIPKEQIDSLRESFEKALDKGELIAFAPVFMPSWKESKKVAAADTNTYITDSLVTSMVLNEDNMPIAKESGDVKYKKTMRYYDSSMQVGSAMTHITIIKAIEDGKFTIDDIMPHLEKVRDINPETYESILKGFKHLFDGNYYEALSLLLPQLEDLLADVMVGLGISRYRQAEVDIVDYKMLGSILTALEKKFGSNAYHFLHYQLIDPTKANLRNFNGHGKLKATTPNLDHKAVAVLQAYLVVLVPLKKINKSKTSDN